MLNWRKKILDSYKNGEFQKFTGERSFSKLNTSVKEGNNESITSLVGEGVADKYIANLSLHIVQNPDVMLSQAYAVLKDGGKAAFSVWGDQDHGYFFTVPSRVFKKHSVTPPAGRSPWYLNDREALIARVEAAGFRNVVAWNQYVPFRELGEYEYEHLVKKMQAGSLPADLDESKKAEILDEIVAEMKKIGSELKRPLGFYALVVIGTK